MSKKTRMKDAVTGSHHRDDNSASIDWAALHKRLEAVKTAIERGGSRSAEQQRKILKARARAMARKQTREDEAESGLEIVAFHLANEIYGVESRYVREITPIKDFTPIPCTPAFVYGLINVRGQILSIIDLKRFFDLPEKGLTDLNKIIILRNARMEFGMLADAITGVQALPLSAIQPALPTLTGIRAAYLKGTTTGGLILLDAESLLSDERLVVHEEIEK